MTMAHGFAGVKEHGLQRFAEVFAEAGFVVLVHDHRGFGSSGGSLRVAATAVAMPCSPVLELSWSQLPRRRLGRLGRKKLPSFDLAKANIVETGWPGKTG